MAVVTIKPISPKPGATLDECHDIRRERDELQRCTEYQIAGMDEKRSAARYKTLLPTHGRQQPFVRGITQSDGTQPRAAGDNKPVT